MAVSHHHQLSPTAGTPLFDAAKAAAGAGRRIFTCTVVTGKTSSSGVFGGAKFATTVKDDSPSDLIEAIEDLGWRLEHIDHTWVQTNVNNVLKSADISGVITTFMTFRRSTPHG